MKLKKLLLPALSFAMALFVSGLLVAFSDAKVLALKSHPL
jgi:simple sugar transport system permease protein